MPLHPIDRLTPEDPLHAEAAKWFVRIHAQEPSTEDISDWQRWLTANEAHRQAFSRFEDLWKTIGQTELHFRAHNPQHAATQLTARPSRAVQRRGIIALAAAVIGFVCVGLLLSKSAQSTRLPESAVVETRIAETRSYSLADGSTIDVGARSRVVVDFSGSARTIIIDAGEAFFKVAHERRPFVVRAGFGTVTAVGTAFNVHQGRSRVTVAVVEGVVTVSELSDDSAGASKATLGVSTQDVKQPSVFVRAGEGVVYGRGAKAPEAIDPRVATGWRQGRLKFIREPLGDVVADVERYTNMQLSIADPAVAELLYTGTVIPNEVDDWLELLPHAFPIHIQRVNKQTVLLKLRAEPAITSEHP